MTKIAISDIKFSQDQLERVYDKIYSKAPESLIEELLPILETINKRLENALEILDLE